MTLMPALRITADLAKVGSFRTSNRTQSFYLWRENDFFLQLSVFRSGQLQDLSHLSFAIAEIKPLSEAGFSPDSGGKILAHKKLLPAEFDLETTEETWLDGSRQQLNFHFSARDLTLPAGDCWLVVWGEIAANRSIVTLAAGRITFLASALSRALIDSADGQPEVGPSYTREESDRRFAGREHNLADLADLPAARENLGLKSAAVHELLDEDDLHSASDRAIPTQKSVKAYVDAAIDSLAGEIKNGANSGENAAASDFLWPANASLTFWHCGHGPISVPTGTTISTADRWYVGHPNSTGTRVLREAIPDDPDNYALVCSQRNGGNFTYPICCYYPLTVEETRIFRGREITIGFDLAQDHSQVDGETVFFKTLANRSKSGTHQKLDALESYGNTGEVLAAVPVQSLTANFQRYSVTLTVPEDVTQLCFQLTYSATPNGLAIGSVLKIARCRIDFGPKARAYVTPDFSEEYRRLLATHQLVTLHFSGTVTEGKSCSIMHQFAVPFRQQPVCLWAKDRLPAEGFNAAAIGDISSIDGSGFTIVKSPKTSGGYGVFETSYLLAFPFWQ